MQMQNKARSSGVVFNFQKRQCLKKRKLIKKKLKGATWRIKPFMTAWSFHKETTLETQCQRTPPLLNRLKRHKRTEKPG